MSEVDKLNAALKASKADLAKEASALDKERKQHAKLVKAVRLLGPNR